MTKTQQRDFTLEPDDNERLANLAGPFDEHLRQIELRLGVEIANRGNIFRVTGARPSVRAAERVLRELYDATAERGADRPADQPAPCRIRHRRARCRGG